MVELDVTLTPTAKIVACWITIDDQDVILHQNVGSVEVDDDPDHSVSIWYKGGEGGSVSYEIKRGTRSLVKGKNSISAGQKFGHVGGVFKI